MTAPDRIALRWELGAAVTSGPLMDHPDYTQYVRADLVRPAPLAEALAVPEVAALVEAAKRALQFTENTESELGMTLESGDMLRAAIRAIGEGRNG